MSTFPIGIIALIIISVLIFFGLAHRVLDRMRISDKTALAILAAIAIGSFIDIPITSGRINASINVGGGLIPVGLAFYVLSKAGTGKELLRTLLATAVTAGVIYYIGTVFMSGDPGAPSFVLDPIWVYPLVGGLVAYLAGRSRRSAFITATLGVLSLDIINWVYLGVTRTPGKINIGGAGAFDSIILAGFVAVLLAEIIGESRERLQGGPASKGRPKELINSLENNEYAVKNLENNDNTVKEKTVKEKRLEDDFSIKREVGEKDE